jgi:hypothetical protein
MQPHQQRVVDEKAELDDKMDKLDKFISHNDLFLKLPLDEQARLVEQYRYMERYSDVLHRRIEAFQ